MDQDEVRRRIENAIRRFIDRDLELLARDVNERSITHRFGMYLQDEFPEMDVDCEYNRSDFDVKRLAFYPTTVSTDDADARTVFPDIIIHKRGPSGPNLVVIEAKKSGKPEGDDRQKLEAFKVDVHMEYEHVVFLKFRTGSSPGVEDPEFL